MKTISAYKMVYSKGHILGGLFFAVFGLTALSAVMAEDCSWSAGANLPSVAVRGVGVYFPANGKFYVMGGRSSDAGGSDFMHPFEYNPATNTWTTKAATYPDNQVNNMACGVLTQGGTSYIYCVGGSAAGQTTATGRVFRYDPISDTISPVMAPWPGVGGGNDTLPGGFTVFQNKLYILGGFQINVAMTNLIFEFTPDTNSWVQKMATLPTALGYIPTTTIGDFIYTGGGSSYTGGAPADTQNAYRYDPVADMIADLPAIPTATGETRAVTVNNQMWVLGGGRNSPNPSNHVYIYDPVIEDWIIGPSFTTARRNFSADSNGARIWLAGGYDMSGATALNSTEIFHCSSSNFNNIPLANGGFETGSLSPWVVDGTNPTPTVTNTEEHSGSFSALLGTVSGPEPTGDGSFYQEITVPASGGTLAYWWMGGTTDSIDFDWQDAYVTDTSDMVLATISHTCADTGGWIRQTFDLTPYAGQTVRIKFLVHQDGFGDDTWMYVDDVGLISPNANFVLYQASTRRTSVWRMNGNALTSSVFGPTLPSNWSLIGNADFNGDANPDYLLFRPSTRQTSIWYLSGVAYASALYGPILPAGWAPVAAADFNADHKPDLVLYNASTRRTAIWYLNNNVYVSAAYGPTLPAGWTLVGVADFNGDGKPDYLLFNATTRASAIWYLSGTTYMSALFGPTIASGYTLADVGDLNGDGRPDLILYNASTHRIAIWYLNNNAYVSAAFGPFVPNTWSLVDTLPSAP